MNDPVRPNDLIILRHNLQEQNLSQGRIGRVLQVFLPDEFEVEFVDEHDNVVGKARLKTEQVELLRLTLDEAGFWKLIEDAKAASGGDSDRQVELLIDTLATMSIADIIAFDLLFHDKHGFADRLDLWAAAYIIGNGCGNDAFMDFRAWLIAQGRHIFYDTLRDAEILADIVAVEENDFGKWGNVWLEKMNAVAGYAFKKKTGEDMPMSLLFRLYTHHELIGEEWDEATVYKKYPKLAARFWNDL